MKLRLLILLFLFAFAPLRALAGVEQISEKEFRELAQELSAKVNLFAEGWRTNPDAEFYGGTTRDYLYWLKGQFQNVHSHAEAAAELKKLRALPMIDVRDFIVGDSDVDIISAHPGALNAEAFGVRKIDFQSPDLLDPSTEIGKNEILQGYIPAEKVRLAHDGFHPGTLGDGIAEIYHGKLSVHFSSPQDFAKSKYAQEGINHPVLLALRYLRVQAINYYRSYGSGFPEAEKLLASLDDESARAVREVIRHAVESGELTPYFEKNKFQSWLNGALQKAFRSYTNPTAALELMKQFGVDELVARYPHHIEPLNQYVFAKHRDAKEIQKALSEKNVNEAQFYRDPKELFPDGYFYHGTKTEPAFRGILFQGVLPSDSGSGGKGLYGVAESNKHFSEEWAGDKNRLLRLPVKPDAKIVDITHGEGARIWAAAGLGYEDFAERFGVDILRYPYHTQAFVVKNAQALGRADGVYRKIMSLGELIERAKTITSPTELASLISVNSLNQRETELLWNSSAVSVSDVASLIKHSEDAPLVETLLSLPKFRDEPEVLAEFKTMLHGLMKGDAAARSWRTAVTVLEKRKDPSPAFVAVVDSLFKDIYKMNSTYLSAITGTGSPAPQALAWILKNIDTGLRVLGKNDSARGVPAFLTHAKMTKEEVAQATQVFKKSFLEKLVKEEDEIAQQEKDTLGRALGEALLRHQAAPDEVKEWLLSKNWTGPGQSDEAWQNIKLLIDYFPDDPRTAEKVERFTKTYHNRLLHGLESKRESFELNVNRDFFQAEAPRLRRYPAVKDQLLGLVDSPSHKPDFQASLALSHYELSPSEWKRFIDKLDLMAGHLDDALARIPDVQENRIALVNKYLNSYDWSEENQARLVKKILSLPDQKSVGAYLKEMVSTDKIFAVKPFTNAKFMEVGRVFKLIGAGVGDFDDELKEKSLSFLEKYSTFDIAQKNQLNEDQLLKMIPEGDTTSRDRLRRLGNEGRISKNCAQAFAVLGIHR